jgi:methyl-accepting chemotaxis protein
MLISRCSNTAIGNTRQSAEAVQSASNDVTSQSSRMAGEVKNFFVALRTGPLDRRHRQDASYKGPERRRDREQKR